MIFFLIVDCMLLGFDVIVYVLQIKMKGIDGYLGPVCPFEGKNFNQRFYFFKHFSVSNMLTRPWFRWAIIYWQHPVFVLFNVFSPISAVKRERWSFLLLVCVLLVCLSVLGAHAFQGALKSENDTHRPVFTNTGFSGSFKDQFNFI